MKSRSLLLLGILTLSVLQGASASSLYLKSRGGSLNLEVLDAFYTSLDDDGMNNDVRVILKLHYEGHLDLLKVVTGLILPSGFTSAYTVYSLIVNGDFIVTIDFHEEAVESGWYTFYIHLTLSYGQVSGSCYQTFDPPEEKKGGDPHIEIGISG